MRIATRVKRLCGKKIWDVVRSVAIVPVFFLMFIFVGALFKARSFSIAEDGNLGGNGDDMDLLKDRLRQPSVLSGMDREVKSQRQRFNRILQFTDNSEYNYNVKDDDDVVSAIANDNNNDLDKGNGTDKQDADRVKSNSLKQEFDVSIEGVHENLIDDVSIEDNDVVDVEGGDSRVVGHGGHNRDDSPKSPGREDTRLRFRPGVESSNMENSLYKTKIPNRDVFQDNKKPNLAGVDNQSNHSIFSSRSATPSKSKQKFSSSRKKGKNPSARNTTEIPIQRLPHAIVIGVKKAGTRALLQFLRFHPDVEGTGPEPHFFDNNYRKGLEWYRSLMPKTYKGQLTAEKSPGYFVSPEVPKRIKKALPDAKLLVVLRDPVTRAISDYAQAVSKRKMKPFEEIALLNEELGIVNSVWSAIRIGIYAKHLERWLQVFPRSQIHLVDGAKLISEPAREMQKVEKFLGLRPYIKDEHFFLKSYKGAFPCLNKNGDPLCLVKGNKGRIHPKVREDVLRRLREFYRPFNAKFYQMVHRNFGWKDTD